MIEKFPYYVQNTLVRPGSPDIQEALSLIRKAVSRVVYVSSQKNDEAGASFVFEDVYEAIQEAAQALMALQGYKPYSHEAVIAFVRDHHNITAADIAAFDRYRILRNKCIYKGATVSATVCQEAAEFMKCFVPLLKRLFEEKSHMGI